MNKAVVISAICLSLMFGGNAFPMDRYDGHDSDYGDDSDLVVMGRPVNIQGLTGLLITDSAYTLPEGKFEVGLSASGENSDVPNFSVIQGGLTATLGVTDRVEVAVKGQLAATNVGSAATREIGAGDTDILVKWRFASQGDTLPAWALGFGVTLPTGNRDKGMSDVQYGGFKLMLIGTSEKRILDDSFIGVYFEGEIVANDEIHRTGDTTYEDTYGVFNAGLLFPISDDNRLQAAFEYNKVFNKDVVTLYESNYTAFTPSLRYAGEHFNVQAGVQFLNKSQTGYSNDNRLIGSLSYIF